MCGVICDVAEDAVPFARITRFIGIKGPWSEVLGQLKNSVSNKLLGIAEPQLPIEGKARLARTFLDPIPIENVTGFVSVNHVHHAFGGGHGCAVVVKRLSWFPTKCPPLPEITRAVFSSLQPLEN